MSLECHTASIIGDSASRINNVNALLYALDMLITTAKLEDDQNPIKYIKQFLENRQPGTKITTTRCDNKKPARLDKETARMRINTLKNKFGKLSVTDANKATPFMARQLQYRQKRAGILAQDLKDLQKLTLISVGTCLCLEFEIVLPLEPDGKPAKKQETKRKRVTYVLMGFLAGLINYHAKCKDYHFTCGPRQSFGFLRPTVSELGGGRIRISLGLEPKAFDECVKNALRDFSSILININFSEIIEKAKGMDQKNNARKWLSFYESMFQLELLKKINPELAGHAFANQAFQNYLTNFIYSADTLTARFKDTEQQVLLQTSSHSVDPQQQAQLSEPIFYLLQRILNYAVEYISKIEQISENSVLANLSNSYWHILQKLYKNCTKAHYLLKNLERYELSHLSVKAQLLTDNILEYLLVIDSLEQVRNQLNPVELYLETEKAYSSRTFELNQTQVLVFIMDSGEQAIIDTLINMDMQFYGDDGPRIKETQRDPEVRANRAQIASEHTVYLFEDSIYFEVGHFVEKVDKLCTKQKKAAKVLFIDVTVIDKLKLEEFVRLRSVVIDVTNNPLLPNNILKAKVQELLAAKFFVSLVMSDIKHNQLGLDKFQSGKVVHLLPQGMSLHEDVIDAFTKVNNIAECQQAAHYLQRVNEICQDKISPSQAEKSEIAPALQQQCAVTAEKMPRVAMFSPPTLIIKEHPQRSKKMVLSEESSFTLRH